MGLQVEAIRPDEKEFPLTLSDLRDDGLYLDSSGDVVLAIKQNGKTNTIVYDISNDSPSWFLFDYAEVPHRFRAINGKLTVDLR